MFSVAPFHLRFDLAYKKAIFYFCLYPKPKVLFPLNFNFPNLFNFYQATTTHDLANCNEDQASQERHATSHEHHATTHDRHSITADPNLLTPMIINAEGLNGTKSKNGSSNLIQRNLLRDDSSSSNNPIININLSSDM